MIEEEKHKNIRKILKGLPKLHSGKDFEQKLFQKVGLLDHETLAHQLAQKYSRLENVRKWYFNIFKPSFASALGLTVILLVVIIFYFNYFIVNDRTKLTDTEQLPPTESKKYSVLELDSLSAKVESLGKEKRDFADYDITASPKETFTDFGERKTEKEDGIIMEQKLSDDRLESDTEPVREKDGEMEEDMKIEKKEAPAIYGKDKMGKDKIERKADEKKVSKSNIPAENEQSDESTETGYIDSAKTKDTTRAKKVEAQTEDSLKRPPFQLLDEEDSLKK